MKILMAIVFASSFSWAAENPFSSFAGDYQVTGGECMTNAQKVPCTVTTLSVRILDDTAFLKEATKTGGESHELFLRSQKDLFHWDVAEIGGNAPDFVFWRRNLSEKSGHVQTVLRQFTRREDHVEYSLTFYEKKDLNGPRININNKYRLEPL